MVGGKVYPMRWAELGHGRGLQQPVLLISPPSPMEDLANQSQSFIPLSQHVPRGPSQHGVPSSHAQVITLGSWNKMSLPSWVTGYISL